MPRILFVHTSAVLGGSEKAFLDLMKRYPDNLAADTFFLLPGHGPLEDRLLAKFDKSDQVTVMEWPKRFESASRKFPWRSLFWTALSVWGLFKYMYRLHRFIKNRNIEIVYSNGIKCHILTAILGSVSRVNTVWHLQDFFPNIPMVNLFLRLFGREPRLVIANSKSVLHDFFQHMPRGWVRPSGRVIHNSVDPSEFFPKAQTAKLPIVVSLVGMLTPWKGQDVFIEAMRLIHSARPECDIRGWLVGGEVYKTAGESGYGQQLTSLIIDKNLQQTVIMKGLVDDVRSIYSESEIVVHCSVRPEPFGRVIIEAMACECAVIASRSGGVLEIIESEKDGLLIESGKPEELAEAILRLVDDSALRRRLGREARQTVLRKFNSALFASAILTELEGIA